MGNTALSKNRGFHATACPSTKHNTNVPISNGSDKDDNHQHPPTFQPTFNYRISDMMLHIADLPTFEMDNNSSNSANSNSPSASPSKSNNDECAETKQKSKYEHIKLNFVKPENYVHNISSVFTYRKQLGCGASCRVLLGNDKKNLDKLYALKEMLISDELNRLLFATEYKILKILSGHKNILSYHSSYIDKYCYYLSTTYCSGGTMLDRIIKQKHFNEKECSEFIKDVLTGIKFMHDNKIVHRDIKCQNLIFDKPGNDGIVKIIDFGHSEIITNPKEIDTIFVGSLHYLPPELLCKKQRIKEDLYKGDMWAVGVVCYILVSGKVPFSGHNQSETLQRIKEGKLKWPKKVKLSHCCQDFISSLLNTNLEERMTASQALQHPWISQKGKARLTDFGDSHLKLIQLFSRANKLQKILVNAILSEMDKTEKQILLTAIRDLDMNGDGNVDEHDIISYILMHHKNSIDPENGSMVRVGSKGSDLTQESLHDIDIDEILDTIDEETNVVKDECIEIKVNDECDDLLDVLPDVIPDIHTEISVDRFHHIMGCASKEYDIHELVEALQPTPTGKIPLQNINMFNRPLHSRQSIIKHMKFDMNLPTLTSVAELKDEDEEEFID